MWTLNNSRRWTGDVGFLFRVQLDSARNEGKAAMDHLKMSDRTLCMAQAETGESTESTTS